MIEYILGITLVLHILFAFINTVSIREAYWLSPRKRTAELLLNWCVPIFGPMAVFSSGKSPFGAENRNSGEVGGSDNYSSDGSDSGGGGD